MVDHHFYFVQHGPPARLETRLEMYAGLS